MDRPGNEAKLRAEAGRLLALASQCDELALATPSDQDRQELVDASCRCRELAAELHAALGANGL